MRMPGYNVEEEIELLAGHIKRLGRQEAEGYQVTFKVSSKLPILGEIFIKKARNCSMMIKLLTVSSPWREP